MTDFEKWQIIVQVAVALATLLLAIVAVGSDRIKHWFGLRPQLVLALLDPKGELVNATISGDEAGGEDGAPRVFPARYYHLKVSNKNRWAPAADVRIVIIALYKPGADGNLVLQPLSGPLQLHWRFASFHTLFSTVGPDDTCDLGHLMKGDKFKLVPYVFPSNFTGVLEANQGMRVEMRVEVQAIAANAESRPLYIDISWDGEWKDGDFEMSSHLVVKEVKVPRGSRTR